MAKQMVFAQPLCCIDYTYVKDGVHLGQFSGETLEQIQARYPGTQLVDLEEFIANKEKELTKDPPVEIDEERFIEMLEILPPQNWIRAKGSNSFELSEHNSGRITSIYIQIGKRYFTFLGVAGSSHDEKLTRVRESRVFNAVM